MNVKHHEHDDHHEIHGRHDTTAERHLAATLASQLGREQYAIQIQKGDQAAADASVRATASSLYRWLTGPVAIRIHPGPVVDQDTGEVIHHHERGHHVATTLDLQDNQNDTLTIAETDSKGQPASDQIVWTVDNPSIVSITPSADTMSCALSALAVGTANVTAADANNSAVFDVEAVVVTAGPATTLTITAGTPTAQ